MGDMETALRSNLSFDLSLLVLKHRAPDPVLKLKFSMYIESLALLNYKIYIEGQQRKETAGGREREVDSTP